VSTSGQCTPCPDPITRQFARCAGVASDKRQDHASGTLTLRPSARSAVIVSSVTRMSIIRASAEFIVFLASESP
jgi:hypothetical protein